MKDVSYEALSWRNVDNGGLSFFFRIAGAIIYGGLCFYAGKALYMGVTFFLLSFFR